jgi:gamma-glutamyltranspeptidase/glutathione hydrolase
MSSVVWRWVSLATRAALPVFALSLTGVLEPADAQPARGEATRSVVRARHGMVAAAQPLAVQAGVDILKRGGNAVDAAIAVNACLTVTEPTLCGLGGDLFAMVWDPKTRTLIGLNGSGRAPLALTIDKIEPLADGTIPLYSPQSWSVPGCAAGWFDLHARFGKLPMKEILAPAIRYAEEGYPVSPVIASDWKRSLTRFAKMPGFADVFMPGGDAPREGQIFRNPALAKSLRVLADKGRDGYYKGTIAKAIVKYSQEQGGFFALEDFEKHTSTWDAPISTTYRGYTVWELPPPGQGLAALQMLNILETFDLASMGRTSADFWHVMVEAKKLAFADRARYYADPAFASTPVEQLLSKDYAKQRAALIDMKRAAQTDSPGEIAALDRRETTYLCTADAGGMMVSLIQSNYTGFGSGYVIPELGFGIQNRGALFSLDPNHPNALVPGKRPFHTIIPAFLTRDGEPLMAFGLMGGGMQPQGHCQVLVNILDLGMNIQAAGDVPRFYHTGSSEPTGTTMTGGGELHIEDGLDAALLEELRRRGHVMTPIATGQYGGYQAIWRDPETKAYVGATEMRKDGCAIGY